jgi:hypothetical protein
MHFNTSLKNLDAAANNNFVEKESIFSMCLTQSGSLIFGHWGRILYFQNLNYAMAYSKHDRISFYL